MARGRLLPVSPKTLRALSLSSRWARSSEYITALRLLQSSTTTLSGCTAWMTRRTSSAEVEDM